jgi:hypothetical protein
MKLESFVEKKKRNWQRENNMNDKEFMDKIRFLVEIIKHYESRVNETDDYVINEQFGKLIKKYRIELENLLFGNI